MLLLADRDLVAGQDRDPAPGRDLLPAEVDVVRIEPARVALAPDRGDRPGVGEEELGAAAAAEQLVHVVRGGRAGVGLDAAA